MTPRRTATVTDGNSLVGGVPASNDPAWTAGHVPRASWEVDEQPQPEPEAEEGDDGD